MVIIIKLQEEIEMRKILVMLVVVICLAGFTVMSYGYDSMTGDQQDNDYSKPSKKSSGTPAQ